MLAWVLILSVPTSIVCLVVWDACHFERPRKVHQTYDDKGFTFSAIAALAAVCSALFAGATFAFSTFYQPEDLVVRASVLSFEQIGSNHMDVSLVFTNAGKQPIVIEKVLLALDYGKTASVEKAYDWQVDGQIWLSDTIQQPDGAAINMQDGTHLVSYNPIQARINGAYAQNATAVVGSGSALVLSLAFAPKPINLQSETAVLPMIAITYYDKVGLMQQAIVPIGVEDWVANGRRFNPARGSFARLLPYSLPHP